MRWRSPDWRDHDLDREALLAQFSPAAAEAFLAAGWRRQRVAQGMEARLRNAGIPPAHPAFAFLLSFGGLAIGRQSHGVESATERFSFQLMNDDWSERSVWEDLLGVRLVDVGSQDDGHGEIFLAGDGRVFGESCVHDAFYFLGETMSAAITRGLQGIKARPMLRPDQTSVDLYGETASIGSPNLYSWRRDSV